MLTLHYKTDDPELIRRVESYWSIDAEGEWPSNVDELASKFGCSSWEFLRSVVQACDAQVDGAVCSRCSAQLIATSRTTYGAIARSLRGNWQRKASWNWCAPCAAKDAEERRRIDKERATRERQEALAIVAQRRELIEDWFANAGTCAPKAYAEMSTKEAFLLCGLIEMCPPSKVPGTLDAWKNHRTRLFACEQHTLDVYRELCRVGWIAPSIDSRRGSVVVNDAGQVEYLTRWVSWTIAPDINGAPYEHLVDYIYEKLEEGSKSDDIIELWYAVGSSEVRADFERLNGDWRFYRGAWTKRLEENMRQLLHSCSLGQARKLIWHGARAIGDIVLKRNMPSWKIDTLVPNIFLRTLAKHQDRGFPPSTWRRDPPEQEAALSSLLFDGMLGGRQEFYDLLTGTQIKERFARGTSSRNEHLLLADTEAATSASTAG